MCLLSHYKLVCWTFFFPGKINMCQDTASDDVIAARSRPVTGTAPPSSIQGQHIASRLPSDSSKSADCCTVLKETHVLLAHGTAFQDDALVVNGLSSTCVGLGGNRKITMRQNKGHAKEYKQTRAAVAKNHLGVCHGQQIAIHFFELFHHRAREA